VLVNGAERGAGVHTLPAVPHEIEVRQEGFVTYRTTVTPRPGVSQTVRVELEPEAPPEPAGPRTFPSEVKTSQGQVLVLIPPGRFRMGAPRREPGRRANESLREVELTRGFYMAVHEVSNQEFRAFRAGHSSGLAGDQSLDRDEYPVVQVTWEDAARYCNWLSEQESLPPAYVEQGGDLVAVHPPTAGYRLPLEAEWAWAARYARGPAPLKYPWGQVLPVAPGSGNFADGSARGLVAGVLSGYDDTFPVTAPVDSFRPNERGLRQLGGNVAEWVHDVYTVYPSGHAEVIADPTGPRQGELHTIRGSSWMDASISELRLTYRDYGSRARPDLGFRVVRFVE
jgi:formylglycine-generating enzyme required for sulfatase activity